MEGAAQRPRIYVDIREEKSGVPDVLESLGVIVVKKQLPIGDYLLNEDTIVERKTSYDYAKSLFDGRLFDQVARLVEAYSNVYLVIEGPLIPRRYRGRERQLYASLAALTAEYGARVVHTGGPRETAYFLESLARKIGVEGQRIVIQKKPKLGDLREWQLYIVQSFPGVGPKTAERILEKFGSIERFCTASIAELSKVEGVGEKRAEEIKKILVTPYKRRQGAKRKPATLEDFYYNRRGED